MLRVEEENNIATSEVMLSTAPYIEQAAVFGMMNNYGSESIIRIKEVQCNELVARTTTSLTNIDLYRITAVTGGETVTPVKHDSSASSLPGQVSIVKYPNGVTVTAGAYLRRMLSTNGLAATSLAAHFGFRGRSHQMGGMNVNHVYTNHDSNVQTLTLREGEGIGIKTSLAAPQNYNVELLVHFSDGTNTYAVSEALNIQGVTELFALFNGSGSGVVLYVSRIETRLIRTNDIRCFTLETCSCMYDGKVVAPASMDSTNPAIDSLVEFKTNCVVRQGAADSNQGRNARTGGDVIPFRRLVLPTFGKGAGLASGALQLCPLQNKILRSDAKTSDGQVVLREGEGMAMLQRYNFSGFGKYEFTIFFTVEDNGGSGGGGGEVGAVF